MRLFFLSIVAALLAAFPLSAQNVIGPEALVSARKVNTWVCNTRGGDVPSAFQIGMDLYARHATAYVPKGAFCMSAGALAWLGGWHRRAEGRLLFHGMSPLPDPEDRWQQFMLYASWGVPQYIAFKIVSLDPDEVWEPSPEDLAVLSR